MKKNYFHLLILLFTLALFSCDDDSVFVKLDKSSLIIDAKGGNEIVSVTASGDWSVSDIPEWISLNTTSGRHDSEITIQTFSYKEEDNREAILIFTCGKKTQALQIQQLGLKNSDTFLELEEKVAHVHVDKSSFSIKLTANKDWAITNIPEWISVSPTSGTGSQTISFQVSDNNTPNTRETKLEFSSNDKKASLEIKQWAEKDYVSLPSLPIFRSSQFSVKGFTEYSVVHRDPFINASIRDQIYLGNLLSNKAVSHSDITGLKGYTFNPITISTTASIQGSVVKTYLPSLIEDNTMAKTIIDKKPSQILSFTSDMKGTEFHTLNHLHAIGMTNMGLKLDEIVTGESYRNAKMRRNFGVIYSFRISYFNLIMDLTDKITKEAIKPTDMANGVSYVSALEYGRIGLLVVESDYRSKHVTPIVNKIMKGETLTEQELHILESSDFSHIHFDHENKIQADKGKREVIEAYKKKLNMDDDNWYPISFQSFNLNTFTNTFFSFSYRL